MTKASHPNQRIRPRIPVRRTWSGRRSERRRARIALTKTKVPIPTVHETPLLQSRIAIVSPLLPNGLRLSCGANLECSQTECYNTAGKTFSEFIGDGRRQLQARVRQHACLL